MLGAALVSLTLGAPAVAADTTVVDDISLVGGMSAEDMSGFTEDALNEMQQTVKQLARMDSAAQEQVEGGLLCVTNNLATARSLYQVSQVAAERLAEASGEAKRDRMEHEFRKVVVSLKQSRLLLSGAERCADGEGVTDGKVRVRIEGEPDGSADDTKGISDNVLDFGFDPPNASPF